MNSESLPSLELLPLEIISELDFAVLIVNKVGVIEFINDAGLMLWGYDINELIGQKIEILLPKNFSDHKEKRINYTSNPSSINLKERGPLPSRHRNGNTIPVDLTVSQLANQEFYITTAIDLSYLLGKKIALGESKYRFKEFFLNSSIPMLINDNKGDITSINQSFTDMFGYILTDIPNLDTWWTLAFPDEKYRYWLCDTWTRHVEESIKIKNKFIPVRMIIKCKNGQNKIIIALATSTMDEQIHTGHLVTFNDITSEALSFNKLVRKERQLLKIENKYHYLYNASVVGIMNGDLSSVYMALQQLRINGIEDLNDYLKSHPKKLLALIKDIKIKGQNSNFLKLLGYDTNNNFKKIPLNSLDDSLFELFKSSIIAIWEQEEQLEKKVVLSSIDGHLISAIVNHPIPKNAAEFKNIPISVLDISKQEKSKREISFQSKVLSSIKEGVYFVSAKSGEILYTNPSFSKMFGYEIDEMLGKHVSIVNAPTSVSPEETANEISREIDKNGCWQGEIYNQKKDGTPFWCEASVITLEHPDFGKVWVSIHNDISEKKYYTQKLWRQANYDELTNLANRPYFLERAKEVILRAKAKRKEFAIIFLDLDNFKETNDSLGHNHGDALLIEVSSRLEQITRESDIVSRFGGDEFVILMDNIETTKPATIEPLIYKIFNALNAPFLLNNEVEYITASIGISLYPNDSEKIEQLIQFADQAMYQAKSDGKNNFQFFENAMQNLAKRNRELDIKLRSALSKNEFKVYFQPIVNLQTNELIKAEALIRWQCPIEGFISPSEFISVAENNHTIHEIGDFVFNECIRIINKIKSEFNRKFQISLNKSPVQFQNKSTHTQDTWPAALTKHALPTDAICIEITEGILLNKDDLVSHKLDKLQEAGFYFSIDDFGTGYSSLSYLQDVEFDYLKIDKAFIDSIETNTKNQALCEAIIVMAHKLNMQVIAEGIEHKNQYDMLTKMGCDFCQGYYYSRPLSEDDFFKFLNENFKNNF